MPMRRRIPLALLAAVTVATAGCGRDPERALRAHHSAGPPERGGARRDADARAAAAPAAPDAARRRAPAPADRRLGRGACARATANAPPTSSRCRRSSPRPTPSSSPRTRTRKAFNAGLPCGARLLEVQHDGRFIIGTFRLTERPGQTCQASGQLVRVAIVIVQRHFTEWREIPDTPGAAPGRRSRRIPRRSRAPGDDGERPSSTRGRATGRPGGGSTARRRASTATCRRARSAGRPRR